MHDGMPYDPTQDEGQGHGASEVPKIALFKVYLLRHLRWELANDPILKLEHPVTRSKVKVTSR